MRTNPGRDANRRTLPRLEIALGGELTIGRGDNPARDTELRRQPATRRQLGAGVQPPVADRVAQRALELLVQGQVAAAVDLQQEVNWPSATSHDWNCTPGQCSRTVTAMNEITVVGGGVAGLTAAITCAENGASVRLFEAHEKVGGRARSDDGPYKANLGPHAIYQGGVLWDWLSERDLLPPVARPLLTGVRFQYEGAVHRTPPLSLIPPGLRLRGRIAPVDQDFRSWATDHGDARTAALLSSLAGVYTFHHDPGELSAAFVWERTLRLLLTARPPARTILGGWSRLVERLERHARSLGVAIVTRERVDVLPNPPVIVAVELRDARRLLRDESLRWLSGHTVVLDLGLRKRSGDPWIVSDLESSGWIERYSAQDPSLAPAGEQLVQSQMPIRPDETADGAAIRLERLLDSSFEDWRGRVTWRRRQVMDGRSGALDPPGTTWRDRPAIDRGDGIFLCGDQVAAPGCLSEVSFASAIEASTLAVERTQHARSRSLSPAA
jgi:phytoene dehydrogenase-like protein